MYHNQNKVNFFSQVDVEGATKSSGHGDFRYSVDNSNKITFPPSEH